MLDRYLSTITLFLLVSQVPTLGADIRNQQLEQPASGEYILFGKSMFDYSSGANAYINGGVPISHTINVTFADNGNVAMDGLLGSRNSYVSINGKYDSEKRSIDFITPSKEITSLKPYVSLASSEDAETLLCALNPYGLGYVDLLEKLSFSYTDDFRSLYPSSGFGAGLAYLVNRDLYQIGSYDVAFYDAVLLKKEQGISFNYDCRNTNISNAFPDIPVETSFRIFNTGDEESEYVIGSESPNFIISNPAGTLAPGKYVDIHVTFMADEAGDYKTTMTVTNEEEDKQFEIRAVCVELPDYSRIVTKGTFKFSTDTQYPWTLSDKYGETLVAACGNSGVEKSTSTLYADVKIAEKHAGILIWDGYCDPYHPMRDAFGVIVDGEECYVSPNGGGVSSSSVEIAPGEHRIEFVYVKGPKVNGTFATGKDYAWIKNLRLDEVELKQLAFSVDSQKVGFDPKSIVKKGANASYDIIFKNEGWEDLRILGSESDNDAFSAEIPTNPVNSLATTVVKILFHTYSPGKHSGNVIIHTNAGDVVIKCSGEAVSVPDYSSIVTSGDFDFDTTIAYPFKVENNVAYNSTSKKMDRKATVSMLQANFEVPEGYYGELSWKARVSTSGANGDEITDYATIYVDGEDNVLDYNGETVATQFDFAPATVNLYPGSHFVCYSYTQSGDGRFQGDDRIEVSDLSLVLKQMKDNAVKFWGNDEVSFDDVWISKVYQREVKLCNLGLKSLQIKSVRFEGDFMADIDSERYYNTFEEIPVVITYIPKEAGDHDGCVILDTTAGEVRIKCHASVVDDPNTLMIEDFEDDWRFWEFIDVDGDGMTWANVMVPQNAFHGEHALQSFSIHSDFTESSIDDVAISPEFTIPSGGAVLSFYLACYYPSAVDGIKVLAGSGNDYKTFQLVADFDLQGVSPYYNLYKCSLDALEGQTVRIAFQHALDKGVMSFVAIDDILVKSNEGNIVRDLNIGSSETSLVEYYNLHGIKVMNPTSGIYIRRIVYSDGRETMEKVNITHSIEQ